MPSSVPFHLRPSAQPFISYRSKPSSVASRASGAPVDSAVPAPLAESCAKELEAAVPNFPHLPSVGTWLQTSPRASVPGGFGHLSGHGATSLQKYGSMPDPEDRKDSVLTSLIEHAAQKSIPSSMLNMSGIAANPKAFMRFRPSVGTWLQPRHQVAIPPASLKALTLPEPAALRIQAQNTVATSDDLKERHDANGRCCGRVDSHLGEHGDALEGLRIFVEHVAEKLFLIVGCFIYAFDLASLGQLYVLSVPTDRKPDESRCVDQEILARWDYGRAFLAHQAEGLQVTMWSTADGASRGHIRSDCELLCCDISHNHGCEIVVTLEIDGEIRLFRQTSSTRATSTGDVSGVDVLGDRTNWQHEWQYVRNISLQSPIVEVKVERYLLLAVTHSENGESGAIHAWEIPANPFECLQSPQSLQFSRPPDRVEGRHGGRFIEAFFVPAESSLEHLPNGIYDIEWFDPKMTNLLKLRGIGDWRCDLRDAVARLEDEMTVSWLPLWHPVFRTYSKARAPCESSQSF